VPRRSTPLHGAAATDAHWVRAAASALVTLPLLMQETSKAGPPGAVQVASWSST
jgi:hypothetical protein